ncbi:hypothetical protein LIER_24095 [Lithospermum erythrorhizon]|uniref:Pentatricopeptide repeat-containing protein n=1 Tax=Lithospermum erythrorhizon TaxID=34254 RepID=A0AAV3R033_LITER
MSKTTTQAVEKKLLRLLHGGQSRTHLREIHAHFLRHNLHHSNQLLSHFISICTSLNQLPYANLVFKHFKNPNIFLFNSIIKGYSLHPPFENSVKLFSLMRNRGIWPDEFTLTPLLKACANIRELTLGQGVQKIVFVLGFWRFGCIRVSVVELYCECGKMDDAWKVFDEMSHRDVIIWNLMLHGYCRIGDVGTGFVLFRRMGERTVVSWNTMISGLALSGRDKEALGLFNEMCDEGLEPDEASIVTILPVCARSGEVEIGRWIHSYVKSKELYRSFVSIGNALVDFYCKCGDLENAFAVFQDMPNKNVITWNAMISGLAFNGEGDHGVILFEDMVRGGMTPNKSTFVGVLACCAHAGLVQKGREYFASMSVDYHLKVQLEHYGCMVDILGRSACVKEAFDLIKTMPMKPNAALWGALLSACRTHGDMDLAEYAARQLVDLEPWNSGNYVLLSNIYAENGRWDEVEKLRVLMKGIKKEPGQSLVR